MSWYKVVAWYGPGSETVVARTSFGGLAPILRPIEDPYLPYRDPEYMAEYVALQKRIHELEAKLAEKEADK